ncbi:DMT family transporter [Capillimicrobium parvum]|uniref:EamA domain-containing protein n=1 Tax=Capillimicrobium parvum TaxID=2884022 RepID=A0A9E6XV86_9ACTN|nr:DMT family transporter [Capillimicrobium parvum]UGS34810.1 hypothetical protein DSM104329_01192 [Capillimicrobium parvum]
MGEPRSSSESGHGPLLGLIVLWALATGSSFVFLHGAQRGLGYMVVLDLALWVAALSLGVARLALGDRSPPLPRRAFGRQVVLVLVTTCAAYTLISWAQSRSSATTTLIVVATVPLFGAVLARLTPPHEAVSRMGAAGLLVGLAGVAIVAGGPGDATAAGLIAVVLATVCFAGGFVVGKRLCEEAGGQSSLGLAFRHVWLAAAVLTPPAVVQAAATTQDVTAVNLLYVLGLGVIGFGYVYFMYYLVLRRTTVAHASLVSYLQPVVGILLAWMLLDEGIRGAQFAGIALILVSVAIVDAVRRRESMAAAPPPSPAGR